MDDRQLNNRPASKRARDPSTDNEAERLDHEEDQVEALNRSVPYGPKRSKRVASSSAIADLDPEFVIVHEVTCNHGKNHEHHPAQSRYFDTPRLFAGDSKASLLRGLRPVTFEDLDDFAEENPQIIFIVSRTYSCNEYHVLHEDDFERLTTSRISTDALMQLRPYTFTLRQLGRQAHFASEDIYLTSKDLRQSLVQLTAMHPDLFSDYNENGIRSPYIEFFHSRNIFGEQISHNHAGFTNPVLQQLKLFWDYVSGEARLEWTEGEAMFEARKISQRHFYKLFAPNDVLVDTSGDHPVAYECNQCTARSPDQLQLACQTWRFDGLFRKEQITITVQWPSPSSIIPIDALAVYPIKYDRSGLEERLRERGQKFWACKHRKLITYNPQKPVSEGQIGHPRYIVDMSTYSEMHGEQTPQRDDLGLTPMDGDEIPDEPFALLLPATLNGFGLHDKKWRLLSVEHFHDIEWNSKAFDERLVLKPAKKELIKALVSVHISSSNSTTADVIEGKGKGLIILLHGGPGTGKTLTAESVAEFAQKPLYRVTCGDIGTEPEGVEKYLESVLYIGTKWDCVVLLDEADVFLEERTQTDLQRNALVSVFLRVLEYYKGILILTTNRIGMFDEAFMSRIQLALHYPSLDEEGRFEIWDNFLSTLKTEVKEFNYNELKGKLNVLSRHKLNGRQIRNVVNTARQLAQYRGDTLAYRHFYQAIEVSNEFEEYVEKTHGHSNEDWVRAQKVRY